MAKLYVVRHARAVPQDDLRLPGPDHPLLPEGLKQAEALAERLAARRPVAVYASEARRARETAEAVAGRCRVPLVVREELRELDFGAWGGRTFAEVSTTDPSAAAYFANPTSAAPPGGEQVAMAAARVHTILQLLGSREEDAVVVGHAGSLRLALAWALGMPLAAYWRLRLDCAGLSVLAWTAAGPVVEQLNDTTHLDHLGRAGSGPE